MKKSLAGMAALLLLAFQAAAGHFVWTQTNTGSYVWSDPANWSNNAAPPAGGGTNVTIQFFTNATPFAAGFLQVSSNDLAGEFVLNALAFNSRNGSATNHIAGGPLKFSADGALNPRITIDANPNNTRNITIWNPLVLDRAPLSFFFPQSQNSASTFFRGDIRGTGDVVFVTGGLYTTLTGVKTFTGDVIASNRNWTLEGTNAFTGNLIVRTNALVTLRAPGSFSDFNGVAIIDPGGTVTVTPLTQVGSWNNAVTNNGSLTYYYSGASGACSFNGVISGSGSVTVEPATGGTLYLTNALNTYSGRTIVKSQNLVATAIGNVNGGPSSLGNPDSEANGAIQLGGGTASGTLRFAGTTATSGRGIHLAGTSGGGTLDASGSGALVLDGPFLTPGAGSKTFTLQGANTNENTFRGAVVDNSPANTTTVTKDGAGLWVLEGTNTYTGRTLVYNGVLRMPALASLGSGNLKFYALGVTGILETASDFARPSGSGSGQMTIGDASNARNGGFSARGGDIRVAFGTLEAPESLTWGNSPGTLNATVLHLNSVYADGTLDFLNAVNLAGAARTIHVGAGVAVLSSNLTGTGSSGLTKIGAGVLVLRGSNSWAGATVVDGAGGTLRVDAPFAIPAGTGSLAVKAGTLDFNGHSFTLARPLVIGGSAGGARILMNGGTLTLATNITYDAAASNRALIDGALDLGATDRIFVVNNNAASDPDLEITAPIGGAGGLVKQGSGTLLLGGSNTYAGRTRLDHGTLRIGHLNALGDTNAATRVEGIAQAAYLDFNGLGTEADPVREPLELVYNNTDYIGNTSTNPAFHNARIAVTSRGHLFGSGPLTLAGPITGSGFWQMQNNGTLTLACATNPATTFIMGGNAAVLLPRLRLKVATPEAMPSGITVQQGVLDLTGTDTVLRAGGQIYFHPPTAWSTGSVETGTRTLTLQKNASIDVKDQTSVAVGGPFRVSGRISLGTNTASWRVGRPTADLTNSLCPYDLDLPCAISEDAPGVGLTFDWTYAQNPGVIRMTGSNTFSGTLTLNKGHTVMFDTVLPAGAGASALGNPATAANSLWIGSGNAAGRSPGFHYIGTDPAGHATDRSIYNDANTDTSLRIVADGAGPLALNTNGTAVSFSNRGTGGLKTLVLAGTNAGPNAIGAIRAATPGQAALVKEGPGTWALKGRNSNYTNLTIVRGGLLLVDGVLSNAVLGVVCTNGGALGGTGEVHRPVLLAAGIGTNAGGRVAPGSFGTGTLTIGDSATPRSFTVEPSTNAAWRPEWNVELAGAACDRLAVNGDFIMPAEGQVRLTVTNAVDMSPRYKTYVLMTWTGADPEGDGSNFVVELQPANWRGGTVTVDKAANEVRLSGITTPPGSVMLVY